MISVWPDARIVPHSFRPQQQLMAIAVQQEEIGWGVTFVQTTIFLSMLMLATGQQSTPPASPTNSTDGQRPSLEFSIQENSPSGANVGTVTTSKKRRKADLTYALPAKKTGSQFAIDSKTGRLTVKPDAELDFESQSAYEFTVVISKQATEDKDDLGGDFAKELLKSGIDVSKQIDERQVVERVTVTVKLIDVNEPPVFDAENLTVPENSTAGTVVGRVAATDADADDRLTYLINDDNSASPFEIDRSTGEITVREGANLDFEGTTTYRVNLVAIDRAGAAASETVEIQLSNVNEPPQITKQEFQLEENSQPGTLVGRLTAADPDSGDNLRFRFTAGNEDGLFILDEHTGEITVNDDAALDYEAANRIWWLTVQVIDGSELGAASDVGINLVDVNEPPVIAEQSFELTDDVQTGTEVGQVAATDFDQDTALTFEIAAGKEDGAFAIDPQTGTLTIADLDKLNAREERSAVLDINVTDGLAAASAAVFIELGPAPANQSILSAINAQKSADPEGAAVDDPQEAATDGAATAAAAQPQSQDRSLIATAGVALALIVWGGLLVFGSLRLRRSAAQIRASRDAALQDRELMRDRLQELEDVSNELRAERDELMATRQLLTCEFDKLKGVLDRQTEELESTGTSLQQSDELLQQELVSTSTADEGADSSATQPQRIGDTLQTVRREFAERQQRLGDLKNSLTQRDRELVDMCARMDARLEEVLQKTREIDIPEVSIGQAAPVPESVSTDSETESNADGKTDSDWHLRQAQIEELERQFVHTDSSAADELAVEEPVPAAEPDPTPEFSETLVDEDQFTENMQEKWAARTELNSLRQVANQSARSALAKYSRKKLLRSNFVLGILAAVALILSGICLTGVLGARISQVSLGCGALAVGSIAIVLLAMSFSQRR